MKKLSGRIALVTASTEGIGLAIARKLGQEGAHVVVCSRKKKNVDRAIAELQAENIDVSGRPCHVGKPEDRKALLNEIKEHHGKLDILVCNAAVDTHFGSFMTITERAFDKILDVNIKSTFMLIQESIPLLIKNGKGAILLVSSVVALDPDLYQLGVYAISKTMLVGMTKALTKELISMNIRINCIAPGLIDTKFFRSLYELTEKPTKLLQAIAINRIGNPKEIAGIASFLCCDESSYITGETIAATGGISTRL